MSAEENRKLMHRFFEEVVNQGNLDVIDDLLADDFVEHEELPGLPPGKEGTKQVMAMFRTAFPDMRLTAHETIAEGELVMMRATMRGTHLGEFMGIPPTGNSFEVQAMDMVRYIDGKAVEHWGLTDQMSMMQQLGLGPEGDDHG